MTQALRSRELAQPPRVKSPAREVSIATIAGDTGSHQRALVSR